MRLPSSVRPSLPCLAAFALALAAAAPADAFVVFFQDGFVIKGRIRQARTYIVDKVSGAALSVPVAGMPYALETPTAFITFSPEQLYDIVEETGPATPSWMNFTLNGRTGGFRMPNAWERGESGPWNADWERTVEIKYVGPKFTTTERIIALTPEVVMGRSMSHNWYACYRTEEFGPELVAKLLYARLKRMQEIKKVDLTDVQMRVRIAKFLTQAGWSGPARSLLEKIDAKESGEKAEVQAELETLDRVQALEFLADLRQAEKVGRRGEVRQRVDKFFAGGLDKLVDEGSVLQVYEMKGELDKQDNRLREAETYLKGVPELLPEKDRPFYEQAAGTILAELNPDNIDRLETFVDLARVHALAREQGRDPGRTPETLMAFALSGWSIGNISAEGDPAVARDMWEARQFALQYQNTPVPPARDRLRQEFLKKNKTPLDVLARIIRTLPPPAPHQKLTTEAQRLDTELPGGGLGGTYHLKLPPEYNHHRPHPVLIVLHQEGERPEDMLDRWADLAARNGYILVAPAWGGTCAYSEQEHGLILDVLKDLRRKFQVDSDRVFLFGSGEGGQLAYDVGLSHPDQFAGVLPMAAYPRYFVSRYPSNHQFLPLYVVGGQDHAPAAERNNQHFKDWVGARYPALYVEYKGRNKELFTGEFPVMMDWMNRKTRSFPLRDAGFQSQAEKGRFCTMRNCDNRFYWLSTSKIDPRHLNQAGQGWNQNLIPASLQGTISGGNRIYLNTRGVNQLSIWIAPGMIDFSRKVTVYSGTKSLGETTVHPDLEVLMEDFYDWGDRDKLFLARIDLGPR